MYTRFYKSHHPSLFISGICCPLNASREGDLAVFCLAPHFAVPIILLLNRVHLNFDYMAITVNFL